VPGGGAPVSRSAPGGPGGTGPGWSGRRKRLLAAAAAAVVAACGVGAWLAYTHVNGPAAQAQSLTAPQVSTGPSAAGREHPGSGQQSAPAGGHSGKPGGAAPGPSGKAKAPGGGSSGKPAKPGKPGASAPARPSPSPGSSPTPGPSASPTPSPSPTGPKGTPPPAGFRWYRVTAALAGSTAGFRIAIPTSWQMTAEGLQTSFSPPNGIAFIEVDLSPFTYQAPVRQAKYLQAQARTYHTYHGYTLTSISSASFRGVAEGVWRYHWLDASTKIMVLQVLFTLNTSAGPQSYDLTVSSPAANFAARQATFATSLSSLKPLPG
jgi:hypothetical protein